MAVTRIARSKSTSNAVQAGRIRFPGLDPARDYRITVREEAGFPSLHEKAPEWVDTARDGSLIVSGWLLGMVGLPMPALDPPAGDCT